MNSRGFSLIELLLVIAIVTVLSAMTATFYSRFLNQNSVANVTDQVVGDLRKAQTYAMMGKKNGNWGVTFNASKIYLYQGANFGARNTALDETFSVASSVSISGLGDVNFVRSTGLPNAGTTITIFTTADSKTVTVNSQGMVTR